MTIRKKAVWCGVASAVMWITLSAQADTASVNCRALENNAERLACYDREFGGQQAMGQQVIAQQPGGQIEEQVIDADTEVSVEIGAVLGEDAKVRKRIENELRLFDSDIAIIPHKPTYILPFTYNPKPNNEPFSRFEEIAPDDQSLDSAEAKFQISLKVPIAKDFIVDDSTIWAGYTQVSLWQVYNGDASAPFRETNYEPEIFWDFDTNGNWGGLPLQEFSIGFVHQSNGRGALLSRSWNRAYANFLFADDNWAFGFKPWYRIPEKEEDDDNPDIAKYLGYADFTFGYKTHGYNFTTLLRNNMRSEDNHTSATLSMSFPLPGRLNGYVEYVNGYGETLIDYNYRNKRIGFGVILHDWY
jgi:phospholipase A1